MLPQYRTRKSKIFFKFLLPFDGDGINYMNLPILNYYQSPGGATDFENVEMGEPARMQGKVKVPRRTIYFASGETMEEYSTDEEEEEEESLKKDVIPVDPVN